MFLTPYIATHNICVQKINATFLIEIKVSKNHLPVQTPQNSIVALVTVYILDI